MFLMAFVPLRKWNEQFSHCRLDVTIVIITNLKWFYLMESHMIAILHFECFSLETVVWRRGGEECFWHSELLLLIFAI